jgi:peptidoglycan/LPS O-acetylase OafA/YrhL
VPKSLLSIKLVAAAAVVLLFAVAAAVLVGRSSTPAPHSLAAIPCVGFGVNVPGGGYQEVEVCPPVAA